MAHQFNKMVVTTAGDVGETSRLRKWHLQSTRQEAAQVKRQPPIGERCGSRCRRLSKTVHHDVTQLLMEHLLPRRAHHRTRLATAIDAHGGKTKILAKRAPLAGNGYESIDLGEHTLTLGIAKGQDADNV